RKRASSVSNGADDNNTSPRKTRAPRGSPTKAQEQKAVAAAKAQRKAECKAEWATWCGQHVWTPDPAYRQKNGGIEMHRSDAILVYRKFATLHGIQVPKNSESETEFLKEGRKLFDEDTAKLEQRSPRKAPKTYRICIVPEPIDNFPDRPFGSWESPVYENGKLVGWWLNFQFDPEGNDDGFYDGYERFRPVNPGPRKMITMPILM
ncbi:hypothetical protein B0H13DRAFT_2088698, partial [Mycena leptocephala]